MVVYFFQKFKSQSSSFPLFMLSQASCLLVLGPILVPRLKSGTDVHTYLTEGKLVSTFCQVPRCPDTKGKSFTVLTLYVCIDLCCALFTQCSLEKEKKIIFYCSHSIQLCAFSLKHHTHGALPRKVSDRFPVKCVGVGENSIQKN